MGVRGGKRAAGLSVELANLPPMSEQEPVAKTPTDERREIELEDVLSEVGSDGRIKVWQIVDGKAAYAGDMDVVGFTLDLLLDTYGGGDKSLVIYQGKTRKETVRVSLDPSIPVKNPRTPRVIPGQAPAPASGGMGEMVGVLAAMAQMSMNQMQSSQSMMTGMVTAMTSLMAARPEKDPADVALRMVELMKAGNGGGGSLKEAFEMFDRGMNIGAKINGKEDDGVMSVVGEGMKVLGGLVDGIVTEKKAKAEALVRQSQAGASEATEAPRRVSNRSSEDGAVVVGRNTDHGNDVAGRHDNASGGGEMPALNIRPWVDAARPHMATLLSAARFMSPGAAAETISNALPDEAFWDLTDDIRDQTTPGFGGRLLGYFPQAANVNPEWIAQLVGVILEEHVEDEEIPDDVSDGASKDNGAAPA